jgi:hypothetical protein
VRQADHHAAAVAVTARDNLYDARAAPQKRQLRGVCGAGGAGRNVQLRDERGAAERALQRPGFRQRARAVHLARKEAACGITARTPRRRRRYAPPACAWRPRLAGCIITARLHGARGACPSSLSEPRTCAPDREYATTDGWCAFGDLSAARVYRAQLNGRDPFGAVVPISPTRRPQLPHRQRALAAAPWGMQQQ